MPAPPWAWDLCPTASRSRSSASSRSAALPHGRKTRPKRNVGEAVSSGHGARGRLVPFVRAKLGPPLARGAQAGDDSARRAQLGAARRHRGRGCARGDGGLKSLEPDEWAAVWSRVGERHLQRGDYYQAWHSFNIARWPSERLSPGKQRAYARALEAFQQYAGSLTPPIETVRIPFEGVEIVAYLRLPGNARPAPLVFGINGLDSRKEDVIAQGDAYLKNGVGVFALDMPGTGQAPILVNVGAERMFSRALDYLQTRPEIDAKRIVVQGRSWSGYFAKVTAYTEKDRLRGAVVHGVGIHEYYSPEWQKKAFSTREYLFDVYPARASVYGTKSMEEFLAYGPRLSLLARGMLERPSAPMLLVNGERDSQQPIADLYLLMKHGDPKDVWVNPQGGHMGRSERWPDAKVRSEVVEPWVLSHLK